MYWQIRCKNRSQTKNSGLWSFSNDIVSCESLKSGSTTEVTSHRTSVLWPVTFLVSTYSVLKSLMKLYLTTVVEMKVRCQPRLELIVQIFQLTTWEGLRWKTSARVQIANTLTRSTYLWMQRPQQARTKKWTLRSKSRDVLGQLLSWFSLSRARTDRLALQHLLMIEATTQPLTGASIVQARVRASMVVRWQSTTRYKSRSCPSQGKFSMKKSRPE